MSTSATKLSISIIGPGRLGTTLATLLHRAGYELRFVVGRSRESAEAAIRFAGAGTASCKPTDVTGSAIVLITTPDGVIESIAENLGEIEPPHLAGTILAHCSGSLPASILSPATKAGALFASAHPIQSFPSPEEGVEKIDGIVWGLEGDQEAREPLEGMVRDLGGTPFTVPPGPGKTLYHATAVVASNYLVTLSDLALALGDRAGMPTHTALAALEPLVRGTLDHLKRSGDPSAALTGPIARGDVATVRRHLEAIEQALPDAIVLYRSLGRRTVEIARRLGGQPAGTLDELEQLLKEDPA